MNVNDTRECVIKTRDGQCGRRLADTPSLVCLHHEAAMREHLSDVLEMWALLPWFDLPGSVQDDGHGKSKRTDAPIPLRLDRIALTDPRNGQVVHPEDVPDVPGVLASWCRLAGEERDVMLPDDIGFVLPAARFLQRHLLWIVEQSWVDDFEEEVRGLRRAVANATGAAQAPKALTAAVCSAPKDGGTCGGQLVPAEDYRSLQCRKCREVTDESMLRFLGEKWADSLPTLITAEDAARLAGVGVATIRQWVSRGRLARTGRGQYDRDEVLTAAGMRTA